MLVIAPEPIENVMEDRSRLLFLKTVEEVENGEFLLIDGHSFAISDGGAFVTRSAT